MKRRAIGFATSAADGLVDDDRLSVEPLRRLGIDVEPFVWDAADQDLRRFDAIVIRSCWDYHLKHERFRSWIGSLPSRGVRVWNPAPVVLSTLNKRYLLDFESRGALIPRTHWLAKGSPLPPSIVDGRAVVVKPAISLNGYRTRLFRTGEKEAASAAIAELAADGDVLIQEFIPEIETQGETSLLFFNGRFSHAIRKLPKPGEFRIHVEHGGRRIPHRPDAAIVDQARGLLKLAGESLLYARVDGVERGGRLVLMEFEAIDPMFYLACDEEAPKRFAAALAKRIEDRTSR